MARHSKTAAPDNTIPLGVLTPEEAKRAAAQIDGKVTESWGFGRLKWTPMQLRVFKCKEDEIGMLGGKGSGKSALARGWLVSGNPYEPPTDVNGQPILVNRSYTYHPHYRGLILRKNQEDLDDFIQRAAEMWGPSLGGQYVDGHFRFPSGAIIDCGHMKDATAWQKYLGIEFQRIVIDEAALIPDFASYEQLRSCMRTVHPELKTQILLTSNAHGRGAGWLRERFMDVCVGKKENGGRVWSSNPDRLEGEKIPHGETIFEEFKDPDSGEMFAQSRVWIFSNYKDNPAVMRTGYGRQLATLTDPKMRRAYLEGDWDAFFGSYFSDVFRPRGPHAGEPDNANHVINPITLTPWWNRTIAMDWGYAHETAVLWGAKSPDGRLYVYREMAASQVSPERWGYEIANASREELEKLNSHSMTLYLSHDAFQNRNGDHTIAEIVALGIARVLGPKSVHLPDLMIRKIKEAYYQDMMGGDSALARDKAIENIRLQKRLGITIRMAEKTSVIGWQHCRELMRFEPIGTINNDFDGNLAMKILQDSGPDKFNEYVNLYRVTKQEVLPKLQIFSTLRRLIDAIPKAQHVDGEEDMDKAHFFGKDLCDAFSYLVLGASDDTPQEPFEAYRDRMMTELLEREPNATTMSLVGANMEWEARFKSKNSVAPYTPPRKARMRGLIQRGQWKQPNNVDEVFGGRLQ